MIQLSLKEIIKAINGRLLNNHIDEVYIDNISTDTRTIKNKDIFFALIGENTDGHNYIDKALKSSAIVVSRPIEIKKDIPIILVDDTLLALGQLAKYYKKKFTVKTIAITGSVGKTSTKEILALLLEEIGPCLKNKGNFNNEIGMPLTILELEDSHKNIILEMGMRGPGQINYLADIAKPEIGIITNIGLSHIEILESQDNIAKAKCELLDNLPENGYGIINADDNYFEYLKKRANCNIISFGENNDADVQLISSYVDKQETVYTVKTPFGIIKDIKIPSIAKHYIINSLPAIAAAKILGISDDFIKKQINLFKPIDKRFDIKKYPSDITIIDDTYNANPASVASALKTIKDMKYSRKIAILGDMGELGDYAKSSHIDIGTQVAKSHVDQLYVVGELAKHIAEGAIAAGFSKNNINYSCSSQELANLIDNKYFEAGDLILIKGSRFMKMENITKRISEI